MRDEKKLMPEVLPKPMSAPSSPARQRVLNQLRVLTATSAATISLISFSACGDPLPGPPICRTGQGVANGVSADVFPGGDFTASDAGASDGGATFTMMLSMNEVITLPQVIQCTNTVRFEYLGQVGGTQYLVFEPRDAGAPIEVRFTSTCNSGPALVLRADLIPNGVSYDVTLSDVP